MIPFEYDSYKVAKTDRTPGLGIRLGNRKDVYDEASAFCISKGFKLVTLNEITSPAFLGHFGFTELYFKCAPVLTETKSKIAVQDITRSTKEVINDKAILEKELVPNPTTGKLE